MRYRVGRTGTTAAVLPATCQGGRHVVSRLSRATSARGEVHLHCPVFAATDANWHLASSRPSLDCAELDDEPYGHIVLRVRTATDGM